MLAKAFGSKVIGVKGLSFYRVKGYRAKVKAGPSTHILKKLNTGVRMYV